MYNPNGRIESVHGTNSLEINDSFNASGFINEIIEVITNEAVYNNSSLIGWKHITNSTWDPDVVYFRGYQRGIAGIGDFLLDAYLAGHTNVLTLLNDTINHFVESQEVDINGGVFWRRLATPGERSGGWVGNRYGNMGIAKYIAHVQSENITLNLEKIISDAILWVTNLENEDGWIPIDHYEDYFTTGLEYGVAGVGASSISLNKYLKNETYILLAQEMADLIIETGKWQDDRFRVPWTPSKEESDFKNLYSTGYGIGAAGIIEFMLDLFDLTKDTNYKEVAIGLANDLLAVDQGGYWNDGSVYYITELFGSNHGIIGYYAGASGIALQLLRVNNYESNVRLIESSARAERFIENYIHEDGSISISSFYEDLHQTGLGMGSAGVAKYYLDLFEIFGLQRHLTSSEKILSHLHDLFETYGHIPDYENNIERGFSFNIDNGLAGIGKVLLQYLKIVDNIDQYQNLNENATEYNDIYSTITPVIKTSSSKTNNISFLRIYVLIPIYSSWIVTKKKKKIITCYN